MIYENYYNNPDVCIEDFDVKYNDKYYTVQLYYSTKIEDFTPFLEEEGRILFDEIDDDEEYDKVLQDALDSYFEDPKTYIYRV